MVVDGRKEGGRKEGRLEERVASPARFLGSGLKNEFILDRGGRSGGALGQFRGSRRRYVLAFDGLSSRAWCIGAASRVVAKGRGDASVSVANL